MGFTWTDVTANSTDSSRCGMMFSRIVDMDADASERPVAHMLPLRPRLRPSTAAHHRAPQAEAEESEDVALFRRVKISVVNKRHHSGLNHWIHQVLELDD